MLRVRTALNERTASALRVNAVPVRARVAAAERAVAPEPVVL